MELKKVNMFKFFFESSKRNFNSFTKLFVFFVVWELVVFLVVTPLTSLINKIIFFFLKGKSFANVSGVLEFIKSPFGIVYILLISLISLYGLYIQYATMVRISEETSRGEKIKVFEILKETIVNSKPFISFGSIFLIVFTIFLTPNFLTSFRLLQNKSYVIPNFILSDIVNRWWGRPAIILLLALFLYLNLRFIFVVHISVNENKKITKALIESFKLTKKNTLSIFYYFVIPQILYFLWILLQAIIILVVIIIIGNSLKIFSINENITKNYLLLLDINSYIVKNPDLGALKAVSVLFGFGVTLILMQVFAYTPFLISHITNLYHFVLNKEETKIKLKFRRGMIGWILAFLILGGGTSLLMYKGYFLMQDPKIYGAYINGIANFINNNKLTLVNLKESIVAHRGYYDNVPENSLEAILAADDIGVNYVEFDVMQTKDKKLIIFHDASLYRMTGVNRGVYELTLSEINDIKMTKKGKKYSIPTFESVLMSLEDRKIMPMIEMKFHGREEGYEDYLNEFERLLKKYNISNRCYVTSLDLKPLLEMKKRLPEIKAIYVFPIYIGQIWNVDVDGIAVEESAFSESLLKKAKTFNKEVMIWTVNSFNDAIEFKSMGADKILTDVPKAMRDKSEVEIETESESDTK